MSEVFVFIATKTTPPAAVPTLTGNQTDYNRRVANTFRAAGSGHVTVGDLKLRPTGTAIANHLLCDGSAVSRTQFSELFRFLGTDEGAGDGSTTFNLPNYLGDALSVPATAPAQTVTERGTVEDSTAITEPVEQGEVGGTQGGNVISGGAPSKIGS